MKVSIIGSGFASLAASCYLARDGHKVSVFEKNQDIGGRARQYSQDGFTFDMGPTWYWMPDVFEKFFKDFGQKPSDYYELQRLDPGYEVYFGKGDSKKIPASLEDIYKLFEQEESGSAKHLKGFMEKARSNYKVALSELVYKPGQSPFELISLETIMKLDQVLTTIRSQLRKSFQNPRLLKILEFPVLFLGAKPSATPALYNFMNWADFGMGTWHPTGGMIKVVEALHSLATELGVSFHTSSNVQEIIVKNGAATGLKVNDNFVSADVVLSGADYQHTESILEPKDRQYSQKYWDKRVLAPSALMFYVGFSKKLKNVSHHTLFFDADFDLHAQDIYDNPKWPKEPLFYCSFASKTDANMAPAGMEAATFLIPIAPGIEDTEEIRTSYFELIMGRLEELTGQKLQNDIVCKTSYCINDFENDYNSYKGNAYGLANTLKQTAFMRPNIKSRKVRNLYFTGQLTVPGPGVPPALISGKIAAESIQNNQP